MGIFLAVYVSKFFSTSSIRKITTIRLLSRSILRPRSARRIKRAQTTFVPVQRPPKLPIFRSPTDRPTNQPSNHRRKRKKKKKMVKKARRKAKKKKLRERCAFNVKGHSTGISSKGRWFGQDRKHRPTEFSFPPRELRLVRLPPP